MNIKAAEWKCADVVFDLEEPIIMGILNVTPDSFSDGGAHDKLDAAVAWAEKMVEDGARIIDVGGESTRPGFDENGVDLEEERRRVLPVVEALSSKGMIVSVDTSKPEIMRESAALGARILNDVRGFSLPGALEAAAETQCGLVVMHRALEPKYEDLISEVEGFLEGQTKKLVALGVDESRICWDPGFGFGKTVEQNYELIAATPRLLESGRPVMTALSRKSSIGAVVGEARPIDRVIGSVAGALAAARLGARILRVHDVKQTRQALAVVKAVESAGLRI